MFCADLSLSATRMRSFVMGMRRSVLAPEGAAGAAAGLGGGATAAGAAFGEAAAAAGTATGSASNIA